jgi:ATP-dependent Lon protease
MRPITAYSLLCIMFLSLYQVKEKTIAARRSAIKTLIFPAANKRDFDELASNVKDLIVN